MAEASGPDARLEDWLPSSLPITVANPNPETHVSILDDRAILLNLDTGAYHALNSVARSFGKISRPIVRLLTFIPSCAIATR